MTCDEAALLLSARMDEGLSAEDNQKLGEHLASCQDCRALSVQLEELRGAFDSLEEFPAPEGFSNRVMKEITGEERTSPKVVPLFRRPGVRVLMGLTACLVLCVGLFRSVPDPAPKDAAVPFAVSGVTERGAKAVTDGGLCATLLLERLPEGEPTEHLEWMEEEGCRYALVDRETADAVMLLAEEQSIPVRLTGTPAEAKTIRIELPAN